MATLRSGRPQQEHGRRTAGKAHRPLALRTQSDAVAEDDLANELTHALAHVRHRSTATPTKLARLSAGSSQRSPFSPTYSSGGDSPLSPGRSFETAREGLRLISSNERNAEQPSMRYAQDIVSYDFDYQDYGLEDARKLGSGVWSNVYLTTPALSRVKQPTSPRSPSSSSSAVMAVKLPARKDAAVVLKHEAKVLSHLQHFAGSSQYVVPFFGLDPRNEALLFEVVIGGSIGDLINRLAHMTDFARHQELVSIFPSLALDLVSGLDFMHQAGVVHADIKPQNVLLDVSDHYSLSAPVIRARYIDFSAAFLPAIEDSMPAGGGTWDFMAPEQMRTQKDLNTPTFASDVWSLGITLLHVILLGTPYAAACSNVFMLREAIKSGDPLMFARMQPSYKERMTACQDFIDCCKLSLQKNRDNRVSADVWKRWLEDRDD